MKYLYLIGSLFSFWFLPDLSFGIEASVCHGTYGNGSLENGWQLPKAGKNFEAYSAFGVMAGRNYVHSKVYDVVVKSYEALEKEAPGKYYVYGEAGFEEGGKFRPHKTHQNGLSVDFFVPVIDSKMKSVPLPISVMNKFGYNIEFNEDARYEGFAIDFESMAKHVMAVKKAADLAGIGIRVVIFDNAFQKKLMNTRAGKELYSLVKFSTKKPWVRHDEHYHIDFVVPCK